MSLTSDAIRQQKKHRAFFSHPCENPKKIYVPYVGYHPTTKKTPCIFLASLREPQKDLCPLCRIPSDNQKHRAFFSHPCENKRKTSLIRSNTIRQPKTPCIFLASLREPKRKTSLIRSDPIRQQKNTVHLSRILARTQKKNIVN